jgi:hypothetical protein
MSLIERGRQYRFRLGDVISPDREQTISQITPELEVTGRVMFLSDGGHEPERFAVLEVTGLMSPLVVPVELLHPTASEETPETRRTTHLEEARPRRSKAFPRGSAASG